MTFYERMKNKLIGYLQKPNIKKLFSVISGEFDDIEETLNQMALWRDIDEAEGAQLDKLGSEIAGEYRNGLDDYRYRRMIKVRIAANLSKGDMPTINTVLRGVLGDRFLGAYEAWSYEKHDFEPAALVVAYEYNIEDPSDHEFIEAAVKLDGTWNLDGSETLSAYPEFAYPDDRFFHPRNITDSIVVGGVRVYFLSPIKADSQVNISHQTKVKTGVSVDSKPLANMKHDTKIKTSMKAHTGVVQYLDGSITLNGAQKLDGVKEQFITHRATMRVYKDGELEEVLEV